MGLAIPRPAMRWKERRMIEARLRDHHARMQEYIGRGVDRETASKLAYADMFKKPVK